MTFVNFQLPEEIERGVIGGPEFKTTVFPLESGLEQRNIDWIAPRGAWDAGYGLLKKFDDGAPVELDLDLLINIFYTMEGRAHSFMFKDFSDFEIGYEQGADIAIQTIALGDDSTVDFDLFKNYVITLIDSSTRTYVRPLTKFVDDVLFIVYLDGTPLVGGGTDYTMDFLRGELTLNVAPLSSGGSGPSGEEVLGLRATFLNHVRFNTDKLDVSMELFSNGRWPNFPLIEDRANGLDLALP